jgi:hypothetical protein
MRANKPTRGQALSNHRRRKDKESESNIDSAAHVQMLKQKKHLNGRITTYMSILTLNVNGLNSPTKRHCLVTWIKRKIQQSVVNRRPISLPETSTG